MKIFINPQPCQWTDLLKRAGADSTAVEAAVADILQQVRKGGDRALRELTLKIDGIAIDNFRVSPEEFAAAEKQVSLELKAAIAQAAANIEVFHRAQLPKPIEVETMTGVRCFQRSVPIQKVGLYVPGGSAALFSTVLMLAIPAKTAGCPDVIICTPPDRDGGVAAEILYAAAFCGVNTVYKAGGAQAIAAMAYSTETIAAVDKIFGPGNRYVTKAKQMVSGESTAIDMPAGPSEVMILADHTARAEFIAADLLSQAEHGADSQGIVVTTSCEMAELVEKCVAEQLSHLSRSGIAEAALDNCRIIVMDNAEDAVRFANGYAAEHLIISMQDPWKIADRITAAGSIFIGNYSPESAGDYASGTNHTLPTGGWAHSFSGVNIDSFVRKITCQELTRQGLEALSHTIITMAEAEKLDAHAHAVKVRLE